MVQSVPWLEMWRELFNRIPVAQPNTLSNAVENGMRVGLKLNKECLLSIVSCLLEIKGLFLVPFASLFFFPGSKHVSTTTLHFDGTMYLGSFKGATYIYIMYGYEIKKKTAPKRSLDVRKTGKNYIAEEELIPLRVAIADDYLPWRLPIPTFFQRSLKVQRYSLVVVIWHWI